MLNLIIIKLNLFKIKLSVLVDYIKKCGISVTIIFFIFLTLSIVGLAASSFWLSVWSNDSLDFEKSQELKEYRLSVYLALGVLQCKILI